MVTIRFQNPTQGPPITVWAFVPAALSSAPADIAATSVAMSGTAGALAFSSLAVLGAILSGDSPLRVPPLRGLRLFASASMPDGESVPSDQSTAGPAAVDLPGESSESKTTAAEAGPSVNWALLLREDPKQFFELARGLVKEWKQEALRRLKAGESEESVTAWLKEVAIPEIDKIAEVANGGTGYPYGSIRWDFLFQLLSDL